MAITSIGINAYRNAMGQGQDIRKTVADSLGKMEKTNSSSSLGPGFADTLKKSLGEVNQQQVLKDKAVESFASGENQNVHELMIQLQKSNLAMSLTSTVRNKVLDTYKELIKMPF